MDETPTGVLIIIHYIMNKLTNVKKLGLMPCETYYNLDGFIFQEVKHTEVIDLISMDKEVFRLHDDESESLVQHNDNIKDTDIYGIEVGFLEDLERSAIFNQININLGLNQHTIS